MNLAVISMNAGKLTPLIDARSDTEKHSSGCRILDNMIPLIYGPVTRRPGTKYIVSTKDSTKKAKEVSFIYSSTIAYEVEFGEEYCRFTYGGAQLLDVSSNPVEVVTPYQEADLYQLQFKQSADVMWIVHPSYAPRKLSRVSATEFILTTIAFDKGPFIERNDIAEDDDVTITVTGYTVASATAGAAGVGTFTITSPTDISTLFPANQRFYIANSTGNDSAYTVHATTATDYTDVTVTIYTNETIDDGTDNGQVMVDGGVVTLTASSAIFTTGTLGHTGALFKLTHKRLKTVTKGSKTTTDTGVIGEAIDVKGNWSFNTQGNWDATVEIQRMEDGTNWETLRTYVSTLTNGVGERNVQKSDVEEADGVQYRINVTTHAVSSTINADFTVDESTQESIFRITATPLGTSATATAVIAAPDNTATKRWAEGSWSPVRGYPSAITFFEERIIYAFTNSDTRTIWLSETGRFEDFEAGLKAADSFALTLPTANRGRWLGSLETLAAGTTGDEWRIRAPLDESLKPTNFDIKKQTNFGSADIQSMEVNEAIIFIDSVARKIREYTFTEQRQKYVSPDLTALAEDITSGGITSAAVQKNPDVIIWFTISNSPYLISMTYEREQNVVAFAEHPLGGDGIAESVCVTPSTEEDVITLTAQWTIDGSDVRYIVQMQPRDWGSTTSATDSFFVDAGIVDTGGDTTIDGLDHLEGETVSILADGAVQASKTVSGGEITIDEAGDRVVVGLSYTYQASPMRLDVTTTGGTTYGSIKNISEIVLSLFASGGVKYGDGIDQKPISFRTTEAYGSPPALFTGTTKNLGFDGGFTTESNIVISGSDPLPVTIRAIIARIDKTGR